MSRQQVITTEKKLKPIAVKPEFIQYPSVRFGENICRLTYHFLNNKLVRIEYRYVPRKATEKAANVAYYQLDEILTKENGPPIQTPDLAELSQAAPAQANHLAALEKAEFFKVWEKPTIVIALEYWPDSKGEEGITFVNYFDKLADISDLPSPKK
ncbi:hypothetical protein GCM10027347_21250 [Larkinella harenae]